MVSNKLYNTVMEGSDPADISYSLETVKGLLQEFKAMDTDNDGLVDLDVLKQSYGEQGAAAFEEFFDAALDQKVSFTEFTSAFIYVQRASGYPNKA
ncbi:hypothetical protein BDV26DRAFT_267901 [Aspergillus bertholletiae]|uniref:EF-hand domain-containing protein n=1 Tax=Aspergillus bertholletiae TaxID=1226010 RepID=A0A5N7AZU9_9EURO|nr:hypothetical protein BDV26DRAFT_267901 [Aspergillus bertholletiae]